MATSADRYLSEKMRLEVANGFITPTSIFLRLKAHARPADTIVLPTPVPVPTTNKPRMEILLQVELQPSFNSIEHPGNRQALCLASIYSDAQLARFH
jgi:hypothetical protein